MNIAELCKGSTADSDSVCLGSNPSSAAIKNAPLKSRGAFFITANRGFEPCVSPSAKLGFAFERQPSGSSLTGGKAINLRLRRIP